MGKNRLATITSTNWFDRIVAEADVQLVSTGAEGSAGVVVHARPFPSSGERENAYKWPHKYTGTHAGISTEGGGKVMLEAVHEDSQHKRRTRHYLLHKVNLPVEFGRTYHFRITAQDEALTVFVNDMKPPLTLSTCQNKENSEFRPDGRWQRPWCFIVNWEPPRVSRWVPPEKIQGG